MVSSSLCGKLDECGLKANIEGPCIFVCPCNTPPAIKAVSINNNNNNNNKVLKSRGIYILHLSKKLTQRQWRDLMTKNPALLSTEPKTLFIYCNHSSPS